MRKPRYSLTPHIKRCSVARGNWRWLCVGSGVVGWGLTPLESWAIWRSRLRTPI